MSSSNQNSNSPFPSSVITEKLGRTNFVTWHAQVRSAVRGARLQGHLDDTVQPPPKTIKDKEDREIENPVFDDWDAKDQQVLSFLLSALSKDILAHAARAQTAAEAWRSITALFASQTRARVVNLRMALATTKKGTQSVTEYFTKMKGFGDEMIEAGRALSDDELVEYVLAGLGPEFESLVTSLTTRIESVSIDELYSQLLTFEARSNLALGGDQNSANIAGRSGGRGRGISRGRGGGRGFSRGRGSPGGRGRGRSGSSPSASTDRRDKGVICQVCEKTGHSAVQCWYRFDEDYVPEGKHAAAASTSYNVDTNWYTDSGSTDHITSELAKLATREKYNGGDQIHTANGSGMTIHHVGHSTIASPSHTFQLRNILHVPSAAKNLVSVHRFTSDNDVFIEFHPSFFLIKDKATKKILHKGPCRRGLYPLPASSKQAFASSRESVTRWHERLGHPSSQVVKHVISHNNLSCVPESNKAHVCDACQQAKAHQLPYPESVSRSCAPLDLIFSDVWGPALESVGRKQYYVSFIDDFSKFTWIYLIKFKSEVFQKFHDFQQLVERKFDRKIKSVQTDWGGEYQKLNSFFNKVGITHLVSCPHAHQQNGAAERKHRHIVEVGLALLSRACMPLKFWDEAFLTATYLINRLPSKIIDFSTPLERLHGHKPDYTWLRTFGCACWPNLRPYNTHKLQFRSKCCVFLGYSNLHKGFKCLDVSSGRVYISRDVVFDESVFPFQELSPNAGARLRPEILLLPSSGSGGTGFDDRMHDLSDLANQSPCSVPSDVLYRFQEHPSSVRDQP